MGQRHIQVASWVRGSLQRLKGQNRGVGGEGRGEEGRRRERGEEGREGEGEEGGRKGGGGEVEGREKGDENKKGNFSA